MLVLKLEFERILRIPSRRSNFVAILVFILILEFDHRLRSRWVRKSMALWSSSKCTDWTVVKILLVWT